MAVYLLVDVVSSRTPLPKGHATSSFSPVGIRAWSGVSKHVQSCRIVEVESGDSRLVNSTPPPDTIVYIMRYRDRKWSASQIASRVPYWSWSKVVPFWFQTW